MVFFKAVDKRIFFLSLFLVLLFLGILISNSEKNIAIVDYLLQWSSYNLGWMYLWLNAICFSLSAWLGFGPYGKIKFGGPEAKPDFSKLSWVSMLFCTAVGGCIIYWGAIEWVYYYNDPPFRMPARSDEAAEWAMTYGLFHWGPSAWAFFCIPAICLSYYFFNMKSEDIKLSRVYQPIFSFSLKGHILADLIDTLFLIGLLSAACVSLGLGAPIVGGMLELLWGTPIPQVQMLVVLLWTCVFSVSVYLGLHRGIKALSQLNIFFALILAITLLLVGDMVFLASSFTQSIGLLSQNFLKMSFYTDAISQSGFPQERTMYLWAWWISYAPLMAVFVAKISKGRTIKDLVVGHLILSPLGAWLAFILLGNNALYMELHSIAPIAQTLADAGEAKALMLFLQNLPLGSFVLVLFIVVLFIFLATTVDSSAFVIACMATKSISAHSQPARWHRLFWALVLGSISLVLIQLDALELLQKSILLTAIPLLALMGMMIYSLFTMLKEEKGEAP